MRILELTLRNYRVFEDVQLELPSRVIGIFGPNGAGKSSLVESVQFVLYGRARTAKQEIRTHGVLTDCEVRMAFEHGGRQYEVRRTIRGRNHTVDAELFAGDLQLATGVTEVDAEVRRLLRMDQQVFRSSVFAEQKQLDAFSDVTKGKRKEMVLRLLGIRPVDEARTAARKEARERGADAERVAGVLPDVAMLEANLADAKAEAQTHATVAKEAAAASKEAAARCKAAEKAFEAVDRVREQVDRLSVKREGLAERLEELQDQSVDLASRLEELRTDLAELPELEAELAELGDVGERLDAAKRLAEATAVVQRVETQLAALPAADPQAALAELEAAEDRRTEAREAEIRARSAHERADAELERARATLDTAGELDSSAPCPTCGQELGAGFDAYVSHCRGEARRLEKEAATAASARKRAAAALKTAETAHRRAVQQAEGVQEAVRKRTALAERLEEARAAVAAAADAFEGEAPDLAQLRTQADRCKVLTRRIAELETERKQLGRAEADLEKVRAAVAKSAADIEAIDTKLAALGFDPEDHASARKERDEAARLLEEAREGQRLAELALSESRSTVSRLEGQLEQAREQTARVAALREDARYLERTSDLLNGFRDHLVSRIGPELSREAEALFRDLTNHEYDDLRIDDDTLAIHIADAGQYFPIERFSGSESDLANLALRVAISMHLSRVSGADIGMMVLDEVLGSLDAERKDLMVQTMGRLSQRFHQLFVITHAEQVKDQFPASIEVRKVGRRRSEAVLR